MVSKLKLSKLTGTRRTVHDALGVEGHAYTNPGYVRIGTYRGAGRCVTSTLQGR